MITAGEGGSASAPLFRIFSGPGGGRSAGSTCGRDPQTLGGAWLEPGGQAPGPGGRVFPRAGTFLGPGGEGTGRAAGSGAFGGELC